MTNNFNYYIENYHDRIKNIINKFNYPDNIGHLLYIIIPAFIYNYGIDKEQVVINVFNNIEIKFSTEINKRITAFYSSIPYKDNNTIKSYKYIYLYNYSSSSLIELIDNLVHEFNHAINSYKNEIIVKDNTVNVRTGISFIKYDFNSLKPLNKDVQTTLEEVLNTKQTVDIINTILSIDKNTITNGAIYNIINSLSLEVQYPYESNSYLLHTYICKYLLENRAFTSTFNVLRFSGNIEDLESWFDNIVGQHGSYKELVTNLEEIMDLTNKLTKKRIKFLIINRIKELNKKTMNLIDLFNENCNYK